MALQQISHAHPLVLGEVTGEEVLCNGCREPITAGDSAFSCNNTSIGCHFILHKRCAELPKEIIHPMHEKHSLTLVADPYQGRKFVCNICRSKFIGFSYNCSLCEFDVDLNCATEDSNFRHQGHHHELTLIKRSALFHCDACDTTAEDLSYRCTICPFWIHKSCAASPSTIEHAFHNHPLTLCYFIPESYCASEQHCHICKKNMNPTNWLYLCDGCKIFAHIKCVTQKAKCVTQKGESDSAEAMVKGFSSILDLISCCLNNSNC